MGGETILIWFEQDDVISRFILSDEDGNVDEGIDVTIVFESLLSFIEEINWDEFVVGLGDINKLDEEIIAGVGFSSSTDSLDVFWYWWSLRW